MRLLLLLAGSFPLVAFSADPSGCDQFRITLDSEKLEKPAAAFAALDDGEYILQRSFAELEPGESPKLRLYYGYMANADKEEKDRRKLKKILKALEKLKGVAVECGKAAEIADREKSGDKFDEDFQTQLKKFPRPAKKGDSKEEELLACNSSSYLLFLGLSQPLGSASFRRALKLLAGSSLFHRQFQMDRLLEGVMVSLRLLTPEYHHAPKARELLELAKELRKIPEVDFECSQTRSLAF
jgi:hypothetical protein